MRSRQEFIDRYKKHLAGLALFGVASEVKDGTLARAAKVLDIPDEVERLLGQMYTWMAEGANTNGNGATLPIKAKGAG